ncbi:MAG: hypothetical protein VB038_07540 [Methanobrevibacter sp.]|uniref:hypothetical protein n=1 Tax=Methanobrevibacter sp. TaxID=66852 RepID=UPI002B1FC4C2|nr:hypothetical protein [Methanobrevibacter sp.]MEA4957563.1 hypothetical protein [Methanobrevibacter sp.]
MAKCKWCGEEFEKKHNREEYCCEEHRRYARQEQKIQYNRKYRKNIIKDDYYYGLGSGGLGQHMNNNFNIELKLIKKEKIRLKIGV